jgi:hypothetical protein
MAELQGQLQLIQAESSGQIQQMATEMAQQMHEQMMQQQGQQQQAGSPAGLAPGMGQGFDPNMGGAPFAQANPGATREMQSGTTRTGEQVMA